MSEPRPMAIVSCDIVGYSREKSPDVQLSHLRAINALVKALLDREGGSQGGGAGRAVWASRGDGGHVALPMPQGRAAALQLVRDLRAWSSASGVALRVIAHYGPVALFPGADGRDEFVGDAVNLVGRLIDYAGARRVVVSEAFARAVGRTVEAGPEAAGGEADARLAVAAAGAGGGDSAPPPAPPGYRFHDPATVAPRYFPPQRVYLLSYDAGGDGAGEGGAWASEWGTDDDRARLRAAVAAAQEGGAAWDVIYYAKRLMQVNSDDPDAGRALLDLSADALGFRNPAGGRFEINPVLGRIENYPRVDFLRAAQLLERGDGERLCDFGEAGDTMFVIVRGAVEILPPGFKPILRGTGDLVGELAFALRRRRTAAMRCAGETALLGFTYGHLDAQLEKSPTGQPSRAALDQFLLTRILKYLCSTAPYLSPKSPGGPLHESRRPWELLQFHTRLLKPLEDGATVSFTDEAFREDGLYVLVGGRLRGLYPPQDPPETPEGADGPREMSQGPGPVLDGQDLPVVYASFPNHFVSVNRQYRVEESASLVFVSAAGLKALGPPALKSVADAVRAASAGQFAYDLFLSYTFDDQQIVLRWKEALEGQGFRVFMDTAHLLRRFPEKIAAAILDSLVLLPLVSANTVRRPRAENWVYSEIEYREACFDPATANVLPVRLLGGDVAMLSDGFVSVNADGREGDAIAEVARAVREVKEGRRPPPFATRRRDARLRGPG